VSTGKRVFSGITRARFGAGQERLHARATGGVGESGMRNIGVWLGALALVAAMAAYAATPDEIIAERRAGYKHIGEVFKGMKEAVDSSADVTPLAAGAGDIVAWSKKIPTMFPLGTETGGGTHALPPVWSDRPGFETLAAKLTVEATKLQTVAGSGDKAAFAAQFKATGAVCGECHRTYRAKL
jgi:cytochrome c556